MKWKTMMPVILSAAGLGLAGAALLLFGELGDELMDSTLQSLDAVIMHVLHIFSNDFIDGAMRFITAFGSPWAIGVATIAVLSLLWFRWKDGWGMLFLVLVTGGGGLLSLLLKDGYGRERPAGAEAYNVESLSFPSGHAMGSLLFYGFLMYLILRSGLPRTGKAVLSAILAALIFFIGISRVYLEVHYPSDVLAGYLAGIVWLIAGILALEWLQRTRKERERPLSLTWQALDRLFHRIRRRLF